jgi:hypothetical protein
LPFEASLYAACSSVKAFSSFHSAKGLQARFPWQHSEAATQHTPLPGVCYFANFLIEINADRMVAKAEQIRKRQAPSTPKPFFLPDGSITMLGSSILLNVQVRVYFFIIVRIKSFTKSINPATAALGIIKPKKMPIVRGLHQVASLIVIESPGHID